MRQRIDVDALWCSAREQSLLAYGGEQRAGGLPVRCPITLADLLGERL